MKDKSIVTARGVYLDLSKSPYGYSVNGQTFKFSSQCKLNSFTKKYLKGKIDIDMFANTNDLGDWRYTAYLNLANKLYEEMRRH